jgi:hypothetical protein
MSFLILDLLEPAREDPTALVETHKVPHLCFAVVVGLTHGGNRYDDEIFEHTLREFPDFAAAPHTGLIKLDEDWMKSKEGKERWRAFINACVISLRAIHIHPAAWIAQSQYFLSCTRAYYNADMRKKSQTIISAR